MLAYAVYTWGPKGFQHRFSGPNGLVGDHITMLEWIKTYDGSTRGCFLGGWGKTSLPHDPSIVGYFHRQSMRRVGSLQEF